MNKNSPLLLEIHKLLKQIEMTQVQTTKIIPQPIEKIDQIFSELNKRFKHIAESNQITVNEDSEESVKKAIKLLQTWMRRGINVRIIGAGRAKLAGALPANRLAHGGARISVEGSIVPMPHSITAGGIIAVSASGKTPNVLEVIKNVYTKRPNIEIIGIASNDAQEFKQYCHTFIGIKLEPNLDNPLRALADIKEIVILEVLDAIIVGAGKLAGFDDVKWRIGHEDLGPTGPYDTIPELIVHYTFAP